MAEGNGSMTPGQTKALRAAIEHWQRRLKEHPEVHPWLQERGYTSERLEAERIGYSDGTLAEIAQGEEREALDGMGLLKENGGRLVFPLLTGTGCLALRMVSLEDGAESVRVLTEGAHRTPDGTVHLTRGKRLYTLRAGSKPVLRLQQGSAAYTDRPDLASASSRRRFAKDAAGTLGLARNAIQADLDALLLESERTHPTTVQVPVMSQEHKREALALLKDPDLLTRLADDMTALGYVGEARNKKIAYLIATSRMLEKPLSGLVRSAAGSGKSALLEKTAAFMPPEAVHVMSRLSPQALFYMDAAHLRHRLLIVDERAGSESADYSLRTLQSQQKLSLAFPVRDGQGGTRTQIVSIEGPVAYLESTTSRDVNPENLSRCLILEMDESAEQTQRVQECQRHAWSNGLGPNGHGPNGHGKRTSEITRLWHNAQRLLEPLPVRIPYAPHLTFPSWSVQARRDQGKLLTAIAASAILHQHQRERDGKAIVASLDDYGIVHGLLADILGQEAELSAHAQTLFDHLRQGVRAPFTRRELMNELGWSYRKTYGALHELLRVEILAADPVHPGSARRFALAEYRVRPPARLLAPDAIRTRLSDLSGTYPDSSGPNGAKG
ncbi:MAG: hypothetical protein HY613_00105 [Candidatus Rokubacteria bacterium]|nr:hypothetical protein [Candidatus Rokubacteria bacterium]